MKIRKILSILLIFNVLILSSCVNRKKCFFIEGSFDAIYKDITYRLEIESITEDQYILSSGVNVIEDKVLEYDRWFTISFYIIDGDVQTRINLQNVVESCSGTKSIPISYIDETGIEIQPCYPRKDVSCCYIIRYQSNELYFERR